MNFQLFIQQLPTFLWGFVGVFIVISLVYLTIVVLNMLFPGEK